MFQKKIFCSGLLFCNARFGKTTLLRSGPCERGSNSSPSAPHTAEREGERDGDAKMTKELTPEKWTASSSSETL